MQVERAWVKKNGDGKIDPRLVAQWNAELRAAGVDLDAVAKKAANAPDWNDQAAGVIAQRFPGGRWLLSGHDYVEAIERNLIPRAGMQRDGRTVMYASPESWSEEYARKSRQTVEDLLSWAQRR